MIAKGEEIAANNELKENPDDYVDESPSSTDGDKTEKAKDDKPEDKNDKPQ